MTDTKAPETFEAFGLDPRILSAVEKLGFETPTPIQQVAIPALMNGRDVLGGARTGSGKTGAFGLPLLHHLADGPRGVRALILAPTRELAVQVTNALRDFAKDTPVRVVTIYGGVSYDGQFKALKSGVPVVVGTPGRVIDHIQRGSLDLSNLQMMVLDEADEMLRMGFIDDVEEILAACPGSQQTALFSATMPDQIRRVAREYLDDPLELEVEDSGVSVDHIDQRWIPVRQREKMDALERILRAESAEAALIFSRTRKGCADVAEVLAKRGLPVDALHGNLSQAARERVLLRLRSGRLEFLVATDVAARGIDVEHITHVINFDVPDEAETYVHRIGRTGRAGREGTAITLVTPRERRKFTNIQQHLDIRVPKGEVPSERQISQARRDSFVKELTNASQQDLGELREWMSGLELSTEDLAAAAVSLLMTQRGVSLTDPEEQRREPMRRASNEVQLAIKAGKRQGVRPGDVVGAIAGDLDMDSGVIGKVQVFTNVTFVGMAAADAQAILDRTEYLVLRGEEVPLELAKARPDRRERRRPPRDFGDRGDRRDFRGDRGDRGDRRDFRGDRGDRRDFRGDRNDRGDRRDFRGDRNDRGDRGDFRGHRNDRGFRNFDRDDRGGDRRGGPKGRGRQDRRYNRHR